MITEGPGVTEMGIMVNLSDLCMILKQNKINTLTDEET